MKYKELKEAKVYKADVGWRASRTTSNSDVTIYENPTSAQLLNIDRGPGQIQSWRGLVLEDARLLIWDADGATHQPIRMWAQEIGLGKTVTELYIWYHPADPGNDIRISSKIISYTQDHRNNKYIAKMLKDFDVTWAA